MNAPRIIPARPMGLDDILPLIREVGQLRERGHYSQAAELEERIRQPITVAGRVLGFTGHDSSWYWRTQGFGDTSIQMSVHGGRWGALLVTYADNLGISITAQGIGPTIAAALADAHTHYQAAIDDALLRMGGLLREAQRKRRECEICGERAQEMGSEARCAEHDSEGA